jgi:hypothetical protein
MSAIITILSLFWNCYGQYPLRTADFGLIAHYNVAQTVCRMASAPSFAYVSLSPVVGNDHRECLSTNSIPDPPVRSLQS